MEKSLHQQYRDAKAQMMAFVAEGDVSQDTADKILDDLRRAKKALRPDKA